VLLKKLSFFKSVPMWLHQLTRGGAALSRALAAGSVASWGGARAVKALAAQARREEFWGAAVEMIRALASVPGAEADRALQGLMASLRHPKALREVVAAIARRARPGADRILAPLARGHRALGVQAEATKGLGSVGGGRYSALLARNLKGKSYRDVLAASAVSALAASRDPGVAARLKSLAVSAPFGARAAAWRALADYARHDPALVPWMCARVEDQDERLTLVAVAALGATEDERALPTLVRLAKKAGNPRVRVYAQEAMARVKAGGEKAAIQSGARR